MRCVGILPKAILINVNGSIQDVVDMLTVPPFLGPIYDYGRLLIMPGLIDVQNYNEMFNWNITSVQDGVTTRLVYFSDKQREVLWKTNSLWDYCIESSQNFVSTGFISLAQRKTSSVGDSKCLDEVYWCLNKNESNRVHSHIFSFIDWHAFSINDTLDDLHPVRKLVKDSKCAVQIPFLSSLKTLKAFCGLQQHSSISSYRAVCLYSILRELETRKVDERSMSLTDWEYCLDYFWNDWDCLIDEMTVEELSQQDMSKDMYRLPILWTISQHLGIQLAAFYHYASRKPAEIFHLDQKGKIEKGYDADLIIWSPETTQMFPEALCRQFSYLCDALNHTLKGVVSVCLVPSCGRFRQGM
eukprot:jgi/Galph1/2008/GphlegSOOS_G678.1